MTSASTQVSSSTIVPIRVDALSEDRAIRIVDTLLFDPTCWPVTLYRPLYDAVEENVAHIAHTILSDAEVQGMGRTVRHFTGRLDLWSPKLQKAIEDQLRPQLWKIATGMISTPKNANANTAMVPISIRLMIDKLVIHEDILWDHHGRVSPFEFAQEMTEELNLPDEATVAIATTILEQLHGLEIDASADTTLSIESSSNSTPNGQSNNNFAVTTNSASKKLRGAWMMDSKDHASIATQVVAQHRSI
mmetsp:Transcript_4930/g.11757  ORF Transcript_4930/g.11757 Transcript_4930/m.11757 type:complete len:247 (-) Transcript_4930:1863-2603(-)